MSGKFIVFVEGETEAVYIKELLEFFHCSDKGSVIKPKSSEPIEILEEAGKTVWWSKQYSLEPYERCWIVIDQDHHASYDAVIEAASRIDFIDIIWSNPCLEAWFLMHFADVKKILPLDTAYRNSTRSILKVA